MSVKIHPYCAAFPDIDGKEFDELCEDLKTNGQRFPCVTYQGWLIDGKNRLRALEKNRQQAVFTKFTPVSRDPEEIQDEIYAYVVSANRNRRHMTTAERALAAARLAEARGSQDVGEIAKQMAVSERTVFNAKGLLSKGDQSLIAAVEEGDISVTEAARLADLPVDEQRAAVRESKTSEKPTPYDDHLARVNWVLDHAVPKAAETTILLQREYRDFAHGRANAALKGLQECFSQMQRLLRNMQQRHRKK